MEISDYLLTRLLQEASEISAIAALVKTGQMKPYLKKSEAFRLYGRNQVEHWLNQGLITPRKDGDCSAAWRLDRIELEIISRSQKLEKLSF